MDEALTIPNLRSSDTKKTGFDTKKIYIDKKRMKTAVLTVFPTIETIASAI